MRRGVDGVASWIVGVGFQGIRARKARNSIYGLRVSTEEFRPLSPGNSSLNQMGNFLGNSSHRISEISIKIGISCSNSMVSGPTNSRRSETIGNDRGGTEFELIHWKYRCIGLELAYKR